MTLEEVIKEAKALPTEPLLWKEGLYESFNQVWGLYLVVFLFTLFFGILLFISEKRVPVSKLNLILTIVPFIIIVNLFVIFIMSLMLGLSEASNAKTTALKKFKEVTLMEYMDNLPLNKVEVSSVRFSDSNDSDDLKAKYVNMDSSKENNVIVEYSDGNGTKTVTGSIPVEVDFEGQTDTPYIEYKVIPKDILPSEGLTKGLYNVELHVPSGMGDISKTGFDVKGS